MKLDDILSGIIYRKIIGNSDREINNVSQDTRENFIRNTLYFAISGTQIDGHNFIKQAIEKGSVAVVCEYIPENIKKIDITYILVNEVSKVMGQIVSNFYENPSEKLKVIAVTGTNGKTTITTLLYQSFLELGNKAALFSTAGDFINGKKILTEKKASSSMEIIELQKNFSKALKEGCQYVCIEATSHALDQNRINGVKITGAIYTNLTQDHLNYHKNFFNYAKAKQKLFSNLNKNSFAIINIDDIYGVSMVENTKAKIISYGDVDFDNKIQRDFTFHIENPSQNNTTVSFNGEIIKTPLIGKFNMYNLLSVYICLKEFNFNINDIKKVFHKITGASGRMEIIKVRHRNVIGVIDYAHSPDALKNVLKTLQEIPHNKIITVIGVGGGRDREKRPLMGNIAVELSDRTIFTNDNPRDDNPDEIINDIISNIFNKKLYIIEKDRDEAIKKAVNLSNSGDIILIAGKGHEDYQEINGVKNHFSDREKLLEKLNN